jgi:hypothetical protein
MPTSLVLLIHPCRSTDMPLQQRSFSFVNRDCRRNEKSNLDRLATRNNSCAVPVPLLLQQKALLRQRAVLYDGPEYGGVVRLVGLSRSAGSFCTCCIILGNWRHRSIPPGSWTQNGQRRERVGHGGEHLLLGLDHVVGLFLGQLIYHDIAVLVVGGALAGTVLAVLQRNHQELRVACESTTPML